MSDLIPAAALWRRLRHDTDAAARGRPPAQRLYVSENAVVGLSVNMPIARTCRPTSVCARACYALHSPCGTFAGALARQADNYQVFERLTTAPRQAVDSAADDLAAHARAAGQDVLRINGVGDLTAGLVRTINALARRHRWLRIWIATRRPGLAGRIEQRRNIHLMLSADRGTTPSGWAALLALRRRHRRAFIAWLRTDGGPVPSEVELIFQEHRGAWRADLPVEPRTCPKTIRGGLAHASACLSCRWCFDRRDRGESPNGGST